MKQLLLICAAVALVGCGTTKPTPSTTFTNTLGMKFVPVPGTEVAFCIWETRVKDYAEYAAANAGVAASWKSPGFTQEDTHPVVNVSWEDANAFCAWLTKKELAEGKIKAGQKYRLPTDAEWSVAVGLGKEKGNTPEEKQMGIGGVYPWGKEWPPPKGAGNYRLNVDPYEHTAPVGSFASNKDGLHDMGGNVWEWCEDKYSPTNSAHATRGASWYGYEIGYLSSSRRGSGTRDDRRSNLGFRCVLTNGSRVGLTNIPGMRPRVKTITIPGPAQPLPPGGTGGIPGGNTLPGGKNP
jgi:hypothetical protein